MEKDIWMVFRVANPEGEGFQHWAVRGVEIREIVKNPVVYPIPQVPALIRGCLWYRGRIYAVIDVARLLFPRRWPERAGMDYYIAVMDLAEAPLALHLGDWLDTVREEDWLPMEQPLEIPTCAAGVAGWFSEGHTRPVFLIDTGDLVQRIDQATIAFVRDAFHPSPQPPRSDV